MCRLSEETLEKSCFCDESNNINSYSTLKFFKFTSSISSRRKPLPSGAETQRKALVIL